MNQEELAEDFQNYLEVRNGIVRKRDDIPKRYIEVIQEAHCGESPNNFTFSIILNVIEQLKNDEWYDPRDDVDVYTSDLLRWMLGNTDHRIGYCDMYMEHFEVMKTFDILQGGQLLHITAISDVIINYIKDNAEDE